jgi:hypothetical protein
MSETSRTRPDKATHAAERDEADMPASPGKMPSPDEEAAADEAARALAADGEVERVGEHYREMTERGAHQKGEGRLP